MRLRLPSRNSQPFPSELASTEAGRDQLDLHQKEDALYREQQEERKKRREAQLRKTNHRLRITLAVLILLAAIAPLYPFFFSRFFKSTIGVLGMVGGALLLLASAVLTLDSFFSFNLSQSEKRSAAQKAALLLPLTVLAFALGTWGAVKDGDKALPAMLQLALHLCAVPLALFVWPRGDKK